MKSIKYIILFLFAAQFAIYPVLAQDKRTLDTKVADLLARVPADNLKQRDVLMQDMLALKEEGIMKLMDMIIPSGTGDDTKARFAVESLSRFLSLSGKEKDKLKWEEMILAKIEKTANVDIKSFFIRQLDYIGGIKTVEALEKYLTNEELYNPVIRVMRDAEQKTAAKMFAALLKKTSENQQIALVNALRNLAFPEYANEIASLAGSANSNLQKSVLACLAALGNPNSFEILNNSAKEANYKAEPTNALGSLLDYAQKLSDDNNTKLSEKICKTVLKKTLDENNIHFKTKALIISAGNNETNKSVSILTKAMKSSNKQYRMAAILYAANNGTSVSPWISALNKAKNNESKSEILYLFGLLKNKESVASLKSYLKNTESKLRQQAIKSLVYIQKEKALSDVLDYLSSFSEASDAKVAKSLLLLIVNKDNVKQLIDKLSNANDGARAVFIAVIAAKGNTEHFSILFKQSGSKGEARNAALENLHKVSSYNNLNDLLYLFDKLKDNKEIKFIEKALIVSVNSCKDKQKASKELLKYAKDKSSVDKYIGVLAGVGGKVSLKAVLNQYKLGDTDIKAKALEALVKWSDISASNALFDICSGNYSSEDKKKAFKSYLKLVSVSNLPADQKLLLIRKIEGYSPNLDSKKNLIKASAKIKTFLSFIFISEFLENKELQSEAANSLVKIILPSGGKNNGLSGKLVKETLLKIKNLISGQDSEYIQIDIENYLKEMPEHEGFVSMFNGKDLSGWEGLAANPNQKKKLKAREIKKLEAEAHKKMLENWSVKDNCIVFNGKGKNLCSVKQYSSFQLVVDWRITKNGDSGIYLRGTPQIQIWDTSRVKVGAQVGSGGLYNNKKHESKPLLVADNPIGEWNTFRIKMIGNRVTVYLNGLLVVDNVEMENYWDRSIPISPKGSIELQAHGSDLAFRNIYVNEIKSAEYNLSEEEKAEGFVSLFNGKDLTGWIGNKRSYKVENGVIAIRPENTGGGNLYTEKEYSDFHYRFEFKLTKGANNGLGIRTPTTGDAAYAGMELQILDNTAAIYANLKPYQYHASVYGIIPAKRGFLKPVGEWNAEEVIIKGNDIKIILNGTTIVDGNLEEAIKNGTADGKKHPGLKRKKGHIGYLGHGSVVWFKNIRIKELDKGVEF